MDLFNSECATCFKKPKNKELIITTPCKHFMCIKCLNAGGYELIKCPLCRKHLTEAYIYEYGIDKKIFTIDSNSCPCPNCLKNNKELTDILKAS